MEDIQQKILERLVRLETKLDNYNGLREKLDSTNKIACQNEKDINEIKESNKWLRRAVAGAFIASIISFGFTLLIKFGG